MKRILIICKAQFGYHIDTYYYCKYLSSEYKVTYLGFDEKLKRILVDETTVIYLPVNGNIINRAVRLIKTIRRETKKNYDAVFVVYFKGCSLTGLFIKSNVILDIRTSSVAHSAKKRFFLNFLLKAESSLFKNISIISRGLAQNLGLKNKAKILPLGAIEINKENKNFDKIRLLYVGTFSNRRIFETIIGLGKFVKATGNDIHYTIVGFGSNDEEQDIMDAIVNNNLNNNVEFVGRVPVNELKYFFQKHNVGIAYVPKKKYFNYQPPTKVFEYGLSGMPIIATKTHANSEVINSNNGILCEDTAEGFCLALKALEKNIHNYSSGDIRKSFENYHWEKIIKEKLLIHLQEVI